MKRKKWMAVWFIVALVLTIWKPAAGNAMEEKKTEYSGNGYYVEMQVTGEWDNGFNAEVIIRNTGETTMDNWAFAFEMPYDIINIWNGVIVYREGDTYIVKNVGSNQDIEVGKSIRFGFTAAKEGEISLPLSFTSRMKKELVSAEDYEVILSIVNDWKSAFQGEIRIINRSEEIIEDWELSFAAEFDITAFYTADILVQENGCYLVKNSGYNANIQPGQTVTLGFSATPGNVTTELTNVEVSQIVTEKSVSTEEFDKATDTDGDGLPDYAEKILGTSCASKDTDGDGLNDMVEVYFGLDALVSDSDMDFDEDGLTTSEELKYGTHFYLADTDGDELTDLEEIEVYHTNPQLADTDGDGMDDGTEIRMGFHPLFADSDEDGIPDGKEKVPQTIAVQFSGEEQNAIRSVEVFMEATGELERTTTIENTYRNDALASEVVGLVGVPVEITTFSEFDEATITFTYDENALGEVKEENLRVMWYDEENNQFVILDEETVLDTLNNTVSYKTTHFSTYLVVDRQQWYDIWSQALTYGRKPGSSSKPNYFDICYLIDKSGSMSGTRMLTAKDAIRHFIEAMYSGDRGALVGFDSVATVYQKFTSEKASLFESLEVVSASGGTNVESGLIKALDLFPASEEQLESGIMNSRMILLLCDGDVFYTQSTLNRAKSMGVKIYPVLIDSSSGKTALQAIADATGGKFYYAATAAEIREAIFGVQEDTVGDIDTTDTDGDGLYDIYEIAGMLLPNGTYVYTDPEDPDTDDDGLSDGEEMGVLQNFEDLPLFKQMILNMKGFEDEIYAEYFDYRSNPTKKDTDGDEYDDSIDVYPNRLNPKAVYIFYEKGGDSFLKTEADSRKKNCEKENKTAIVIGTENKEHFIEAWNNMGFNEEGKYQYRISDVFTIYHGNPRLFVVYHGEKDADDQYIALDDMGSLQEKQIDVLHLSSCNNGNIDWINEGKWGEQNFYQNIAIRFLKEMEEIGQVKAWDGSAVYADLGIFELEYSPSPDFIDFLFGTGDFLKWSKNKNGYYRINSGLVTYYRDGEQLKMSVQYKKAYVDSAVGRIFYNDRIEEVIQ